MNKPVTKKERQARRALALSQKNQPAGFRPRRKARRAAARLGITESAPAPRVNRSELEKMTVAQLRSLCSDFDIPTTTKDRKGTLIDKLVS